MNLIQYTNRNFIISTLVVLPFVCVGLFFSIKHFVEDEIDEKLRVDELRAVTAIKNSEDLPNLSPVFEVKEVSGPAKQILIREVYVYDPIEKEDELFRELSCVEEINGKYYSIEVRDSMLETKDFLIAVISVVVVLMMLLLILSYLLNRRLSSKLWLTFNNNLKELNKFSVVDQKELVLEKSSVSEFESLNKALISLTNQINDDYKALKEFTENASHEIQTPLAVIMNTTEQAIQESKDSESAKALYKIYQSAKKLSILNEKLLLLAKIENRQFKNVELVDFSILVKEKISQLQELYEYLNIEVKYSSNDSFEVEMDKELAEILITNLISNAFKHNVDKGEIDVQLLPEKLIITNSTDQKVHSNELFKRFVHGGGKKSTGIGLSIVDTICRFSGLKSEISGKEKYFFITISKIQN